MATALEESLESVMIRMADEMSGARRALEKIALHGGDMLNLRDLAELSATKIEETRVLVDTQIGRQLRPAKLYCPHCGHRHVDQGEWATIERAHHKHRCSQCERDFEPFPFATVGV